MNSLDSPWVLDDLTELVTEIGDKLDVIMIPKVEGAVGHPLRRPPARAAGGEGRHRTADPHPRDPRDRPAASPTSRRSPAPARACRACRFGPADLAASRRMKTTRVGGGHPGYLPIADPDPDDPRRAAAAAPAGPLALLDRAHGRRLHLRRHPAVLRSVRRHPRHRGLRDSVPRRVPARLRRRLVAAPRPDRDRQAGLLARSRGGRCSPRRSSRRSPTAAACT